MATTETFKQIAESLNKAFSNYNYHVAPKKPAGGKPRASGYIREFRLQLINTQNDTSDKVLSDGSKILKSLQSNIKNIKVNSLSPNSSKFPSLEFMLGSDKYDVVIARGANKGENFEKATVTNLSSAFGLASRKDPNMIELIDKLNKAYPPFASVDIVDVKQRTGSTKKENIPIERLGEIIGDVVLTDRSGVKWYLSVKDINGYTFSSYSGAASLFNSQGDIQVNSEGAEFLRAFGADLNQVQQGFDDRNNINKVREIIPVQRANTSSLKSIFERAWGMNYFYVKKESNGWKVFWIDRKKLDLFTNDIRVSNIRYPNKSSKQITIECAAGSNKYLVEIRNSKGGEYPNDVKIKIRK